MENHSAMIQTIKTESDDVPSDNHKDQKYWSSYQNNSLQDVPAHSTLMEHCKSENLLDDDIVLEATKVTPALEHNFADYVDVPIKMEQTEDVDTMLETAGNSLQNQEVKIEYVPPDSDEQSSPSIEETVDSLEYDPTDRRENDAAVPFERVYTDGAVYEIHAIDDAMGEKPGPGTLPNQPPPTTQPDLMSSLKLLGENKKYKCDRCEKSFCDRLELKIHKRNHQFSVCPVCKRTMRTDFVKRHIARVHPDAGILPQGRSFPCNECDRVFSNDVQLKNHQLSHKKQNCPVCGKILRADYLRRHMDLNHPKEVSASDGETYPCDMCEAVFSNKHAHFFHRRTHQTEECPVCKEVVRIGYLKIHIDTKHPDHSTLPENPAFKCDQCDRAFGYKAALTLHKRKHRLTECSVCKMTIRTDCLKRHMDFNHPNQPDTPDSETRSYGAPGGDTETSLPKASKRPQQTDECPECKQSYRSDYLELHMALKHPNVAVTSEGRSYQCDQCEKCFAHKTQLRLHKRKHRMTECKICMKSMRIDCLRLHLSRMHPNAGTDSGT